MKLKLLLTTALFFAISIMSFSQSKEFKKLEHDALRGDQSAQFWLGSFYYNGHNVAKDYHKAVEWLAKSANQGYARAQSMLGACYENGQGVGRNRSKAIEWYSKAADQGNKAAQNSLNRLSPQTVKPINSNPIILDSSKPPILDIIANSLLFIEPSSNKAIDANELCKIQFQVRNSGMGKAVGCKVIVKATGNTEGLTYASQSLPVLEVGESKTIEIPIESSMNTVNGKADFSIQVDEPSGFGTDPFFLSLTTKAFEAPMLRIVDHTVTGDNSGVLAKKRPFDLQLLLQNTQYGKADNVKVELKLPEGVFLTDGQNISQIQAMGGGDKKSLVYSLIVNNNYSSDVIPVQVNISEKHGKYAESKIITLKLNQTLASNKIVVDEKTVTRTQIQIASLGSDVDKNIPITAMRSDKTFAVIIANENYQRVDQVPYALNDGKVFAEYCQKTLGIPEKNMRIVTDATLNNIKAEINWLSKVISAYNGQAKVIFYYAGHGIPDESNQTAYLLPVDGYGTDVTTGYKLDDLYATLGSLPSKSVTVLLDACFSGAKRDGAMLASARGIAIRVKRDLQLVIWLSFQQHKMMKPLIR